MAEMICRPLFLDRKRLVRNCGMVIESFARMEYRRRRGATKIHAQAVPMSRPTEIHTLPMPYR